jgi:ParB family transcriptional regulator, chromosome partitioning protein
MRIDAITKMAVDAIKVPDRIRRDMGDIKGLAKNISTVGLLHPVRVARDGTLWTGARRLDAVKHLGWKEIPVMIAETANDNRP